MIVAALAAGAANADTIVLDFEEAEFDDGDVVTSSKDVIITTDNFHEDFDIGVIFDSTLDGTRDPDLEGPTWSGGNLPDDVVLGNLLIIQENFDECDTGTCKYPDDEGRRTGGSEVGAGEFIFDFSEYTNAGRPIKSFGFDFVDVESAEAVNSVVFFQGTTEIEMAFTSFTGVEFGNNTANHVAPFLAKQLGLTGFDRVVIRMGGSGAVDNIAFTTNPFTPIPEPNTALLLAAGIVGLAGSSRRLRGGREVRGGHSHR